jgi:catechol 2,3-dioxygenase
MDDDRAAVRPDMTERTRRPSVRILAIVAAAVLVVGGAITAWALWPKPEAVEARPVASSSPSPTETSATPAPRPTPSFAAAAASPGSLPDATGMGVVALRVVNLPNVLAFYRDAVGFTVLEESGTHAVLGFDEPLIRLESTDHPLDALTDAGLYHSAVLFDDAPALARTLLRIAEVAPHTYQGATDHLVSQAFYFGDPEGNGLELYVDRPRKEWAWQDGRVVMGGEPLDINAFIAQHSATDTAGGAVMGHVHLRVGDLAQARAFYEGVLGFDVTAETDGAIFYSAGGYHHHLATNTWQSPAAAVRGDTAGLDAFTVRVPSAADVDAVAARLDANGVGHAEAEGGLITADPWGNSIHVRTP